MISTSFPPHIEESFFACSATHAPAPDAVTAPSKYACALAAIKSLASQRPGLLKIAMKVSMATTGPK